MPANTESLTVQADATDYVSCKRVCQIAWATGREIQHVVEPLEELTVQRGRTVQLAHRSRCGRGPDLQDSGEEQPPDRYLLVAGSELDGSCGHLCERLTDAAHGRCL